MGSKTRGQEVEVHIRSLSDRGNGIGEFLRKDGALCPIEVPFTVPGDHVLAEVGRRRYSRYSGRLLKILEKAPSRIDPRCIHFGTCGGCRFQQISYERELEIKQERIKELFGQNTKSILPCISEWHYRNKMELSFSSDREGNKYLGLVIDSSRGKVFNLKECHLSNRWMQEAIGAVDQWWRQETILAFHPIKGTGSLKHLVLREGLKTGDRMAVLTVSGNADFSLKRDEIDRFVKALDPYIPENGRLSIFLRIVHAKRGMATETYEMHLAGPDHIFEELEISGKTYRFKISPASFFQPNTYQAERLFQTAFELVGKAGCVLDLYSGTGVLGVIAGQFADKVIGIELCPEAVLDARENGERNGVKNVTFLQGRVEEKLASIKEPIDLVMCDPPRVGLDARAIDELIRIGAPKILYISCNPQTQKSNIDLLVQAGYTIQVVQPVDQFPRTVHIENIVVLVK